MEDEKRTRSFIEGIVREHGPAARTYKSALVFVVAQSAGPLSEDARRALAWEEIQNELPGISVDKTQIIQLEDNLKKSRRDLKESVWRAYNNVALLGKTNEVRFIDLGNVHSSAATTIMQFIINELVHIDEVQSGISPNLLLRNWPPAFREWSTKSVRDAFYACPLFPRLLNPDAVKETIARGVGNGQLAYVGKTASGKYHPFVFGRTINTSDVEVSEEMFIVTRETAEAYRNSTAGTETALAAPKGPSDAAGYSTFPAGSDSLQESFVLTSETDGEGTRAKIEPQSVTWFGEIPPQKWMNFYAKVLTKLRVGSGLTLRVKVESKPESSISPQKLEEIKSALRELRLNDKFD